MRMVLTSDLHGYLPEIPPCDVLLIAGDLCPIENHDIGYQAERLRTRFVQWMEQVPARQVFFIAGNHDFIFAELPELLQGLSWPGTYLQDSGAVWEGIHFWGTPWANELPDWPFTASEEELQQHWGKIDPETQILIVHGPPWGYGDVVIGSITGDELNVGSRSLVHRLEELPKLRLVVHGHIHEGAGARQRQNVRIVNASLMNVHYEPTQPLQILEWPLT